LIAVTAAVWLEADRFSKTVPAIALWDEEKVKRWEREALGIE
jgi:hypothetical protein